MIKEDDYFHAQPPQLKLPNGEPWIGDESSGKPESEICRSLSPAKEQIDPVAEETGRRMFSGTLKVDYTN